VFLVHTVFSDGLGCRLPVVLRMGQTRQNRTIKCEAWKKNKQIGEHIVKKSFPVVIGNIEN